MIKFSMIFWRAMTVPMMHPKRPKRKMSVFLTATHLNRPRLFQLEAVSMMAGAMMLRVDILTAPRRATNRSSQGTVAASPTAWSEKKHRV